MNNALPPDQTQRTQALNPALSFIVQAPAGSGKTELLIQRYLSLLATVQTPEEILAITFTKKAANEMRERLMLALRNAIQTNQPHSHHAQTTYQLAQTVLARDAEKQWQLLKNPNRLKIQTIDALNYRLNKQLPIVSGLGFAPTINTKPQALYQQAIAALFTGLEKNAPWSTQLGTLLLYLDNQFSLAADLLVRLLEKRDQWLPHIFNEEKNQRHHLEQALININQEILTQLDNAITKQDKLLLTELLQFAKDNLESDNPISACESFDLTADIHHKPTWLAVAELLLTKDNEWRKQLTKNNGFPSKLADKAQEKKAKIIKETCLNLIETLKSKKHIERLLSELRLLPPSSYTDKQWQIIDILMQLLPMACAQLKLCFAEANEMDYIENAQAALQALGNEEQVTDLALALDYQLKHLLVDEFQDTSISQLRLIEKLTLNWQTDDGKTLFIVGDPMQSIYRFREADVGLFLHIRNHGLQNLRLIPLTLTTNFRSNETLVNWVNATFTQAFPTYNDMNTAAVRFTPAEAIKKAPGNIAFYNTADSGKTVVSIILKTLNDHPKHSIAILVRAKTHLTPIIAALKQANLPYQAIELEQLGQRSIIYDVLTLTKALCHLANRTAWLSLLKAPFCGLSLTDLTHLTKEDAITLWDALQTAQLSADGQQRLHTITPILKNQLANRRRATLSEWIVDTWKLLQADRYYTEPHHHMDLMAFLNVVNQYDQGGEITDWVHFESAIQQLYASSENNESSIHVMTMHKAKGLEFDTVILPELQRNSGQHSAQLLLWQERLLSSDQSDLLLAPIKSKEETSSPIYSYLKHIEDVKLQHEVTRLFYVACTRAKFNLHLIASLEADKDNQLKAPDSRSLLATIWQTCRENFEPITDKHCNENPLTPQTSKRFTLSAFSKKPALDGNVSQQKDNPCNWQDTTPRIIGTVVHRLLQNIAEQGFNGWQQLDKLHFIKQQLQLNSLPITKLNETATLILSIIEKTLTDEKARWILQSHPHSYCEYPISGLINGKICHAIIDRFFIDTDNQAWIIDYKTILSDHLDIKAESKTYSQQLKQYQTLLSTIYNKRINIALYFPVQQIFLKLDIVVPL